MVIGWVCGEKAMCAEQTVEGEQMQVIGVDAGTTSVCGVLLDTKTGETRRVISKEHNAALALETPDEALQDPQLILRMVEEVVSELETVAQQQDSGGSAGGAGAISLTGQVHGILYVDKDGRAVSPLYTWQDGRGRRLAPGSAAAGEKLTWVEWASRKSGYRLPSGYGILTHLINSAEGRVPESAVFLTSILGYLSMRIAGEHVPRIDATDAHSLGLYRRREGTFDQRASGLLGIDTVSLPVVVPAGTLLGRTAGGSAVYAAVGDNQAGLIGAVKEPRTSVLLNVGTSGQMTVYLPPARSTKSGGRADAALNAGDETLHGWVGSLEVRPFPGGGSLLSGASLSGGSAYRLLEHLFRDICTHYTGTDPGSLFELMNTIDYQSLDVQQRLEVHTQFFGTRSDPQARGSISGIGKSNFSHAFLVEGFLRGITSELHGFYLQLPEAHRKEHRTIVAVGNAMRRNPLLRNMAAEIFELQLVIPEESEEAAHGAAVVAAVGAGAYPDFICKERPVRYPTSLP